MPNQVRVYLIEDFDPALFYGDALVVSLSPEVSRALETKGISYKPFHAYVDEKKIRENEQIFLFEQVQWVNRFDSFIKQHVSFCGKHGIDFMRMSFHQLKYFFDTLIIQIRALRLLLQNFSGPVHAVYVRRKPLNSLSIQGFSSESYSALYPIFFPFLSKENPDWTFEIKEAESVPLETVQACASSEISAFRRTVKDFFLWIKFQGKALFSQKAPAENRLRIFFVHSGNLHLDLPLRRACGRGHHVFLRGENSLIHLCAWRVFRSAAPPMDAGEESRIRSEIKTFAEQHLSSSVQAQELMVWLDRQCGAKVSGFVLPAIQHYFLNTVSETLVLSLRYRNIFQSEKIDYAVSHSKTDTAGKAAFIGAALAGSSKVMIQHGCQLFNDRVWDLSDLDLTDIYFAADPLSQKLFKSSLSGLGVQNTAHIYVSAHYLSQFRKQVKAGTRGALKTLLYIPTKLRTHAKRFNLSSYPAGWYFEYQKELIDFFGKELSKIRIFYKQAKVNRRYADEAILDYLAERNYSNISVKEGNTSEWITQADAVLIDRPTTAFFEAAAAGKPLLALYPEFADDLIEPAVQTLFGKSLQRFTSSTEAFEKIRSFVDSAGKDHTNSFDLAGSDFISTLERLKQTKTSVQSIRLFEQFRGDEITEGMRHV